MYLIKIIFENDVLKTWHIDEFRFILFFNGMEIIIIEISIENIEVK